MVKIKTFLKETRLIDAKIDATKKDARASKVRQCVRILKFSNGQFEQCCHSQALKDLERVLGFDLDYAIKLGFDFPLQDGYYCFNHYNQTAFYVNGSFNDLLDTLEMRGLIHE